MARGRARTLLTPLVAAALVGCSAHHFVVVRDDAPLYTGRRGERVAATMRRSYHAPLAQVPEEEDARVPVAYRGQTGYAERDDLRLFSYLDPALDGGRDRDRTVRSVLRELQIQDLGGDWAPSLVTAVREERVVEGMTRQQVELAWGWPATVEAGAAPGGERWIYRERRRERMRRWVDSWHATSWAGAGDSWRSSPVWGPRSWDRWHASPGYVTFTVPVLVERTVEFDAEGRVTSVELERRVLDS